MQNEEERQNAKRLTAAARELSLDSLIKMLDSSPGQTGIDAEKETAVLEAARRTASAMIGGDQIWGGGQSSKLAVAAFVAGQGSLYLAKVAREVEKHAGRSAQRALAILGDDWGRDDISLHSQGNEQRLGLLLARATKPLMESLAAGDDRPMEVLLCWAMWAKLKMRSMLEEHVRPGFSPENIVQQLAGEGIISMNLRLAAEKRGARPPCNEDGAVKEAPQSSRARAGAAARARR